MSARMEIDDERGLRRYTLDAVTTLQGIEALRPDYEHLLGVTRHNLPFALHEWHVIWCRHFLNCDSHIHDEPRFYVLREANGACVAIVPFIVSRRRWGPMGVTWVSLVGADPAITEIRTPLIESGYEHLAAQAVRDNLARTCSWDWINWSGLRGDFTEAIMLAGNMVQLQPPAVDVLLDLPSSWEEFRSRLRRNIRESLRHCYNSLRRDGHRFELRVIEDPAEMRAGLERFVALHAMRADLKGTVIHPDRFAHGTCREFLFAVCERLAARGAVRLFALRIGAQVVAMRLGFVVGDCLYLYYSGFDPVWGRYSVMTTTIAEAIKYAIAHGLKTVSLSPTNDRSKSRWGPREVEYASACESNVGLRSRLARDAYLSTRSEAGYPSKLFRLVASRRAWN